MEEKQPLVPQYHGSQPVYQQPTAYAAPAVAPPHLQPVSPHLQPVPPPRAAPPAPYVVDRQAVPQGTINHGGQIVSPPTGQYYAPPAPGPISNHTKGTYWTICIVLLFGQVIAWIIMILTMLLGWILGRAQENPSFGLLMLMGIISLAIFIASFIGLAFVKADCKTPDGKCGGWMKGLCAASLSFGMCAVWWVAAGSFIGILGFVPYGYDN